MAELYKCLAAYKASRVGGLLGSIASRSIILNYQCMHNQCKTMACRIVICDLSGQYIDQIGGNGPALRDGGFDSAAFNRPQGLAFSARRKPPVYS